VRVSKGFHDKVNRITKSIENSKSFLIAKTLFLVLATAGIARCGMDAMWYSIPWARQPRAAPDCGDDS